MKDLSGQEGWRVQWIDCHSCPGQRCSTRCLQPLQHTSPALFPRPCKPCLLEFGIGKIGLFGCRVDSVLGAHACSHACGVRVGEGFIALVAWRLARRQGSLPAGPTGDRQLQEHSSATLGSRQQPRPHS